MDQRYVIHDFYTRYCESFPALGGRREPRDGSWSFPTVDAAANALSELYRVTRASPKMLSILREMIADGTGKIAWGFDPASDSRLAENAIVELTHGTAAQLIVDGFAARAYFGLRRPVPRCPAAATS